MLRYMNADLGLLPWQKSMQQSSSFLRWSIRWCLRKKLAEFCILRSLREKRLSGLIDDVTDDATEDMMWPNVVLSGGVSYFEEFTKGN